jgi:hypothetical protein
MYLFYISRGMFHGSLRGANGAAGANAPEPANRPAQQVSV